MKIWLDAQLSPAMAAWISAEFQVSVVAVRDLGYREAKQRTERSFLLLDKQAPSS